MNLFQVKIQENGVHFDGENNIITVLKTNQYFKQVMELIDLISKKHSYLTHEGEFFDFDKLPEDLQSKLIAYIDYCDHVKVKHSKTK